MRKFAGVMAAAAVAATALTATTPTEAEAGQRRVDNRPNIVIVLLDDMRADELVAMPHATELIQNEGAIFENAYSPFPVCCPARATILTGQYAHNHKVLSNHFPTGGVAKFDDDSTLATWVDGKRYTTGYVGKYLNEYGTKTEKTYVPPGWNAWKALAGGVFNYVDFLLNSNGRLVGYDNTYQTVVLGNKSRNFIRQQSNAGPFVLVTALLAPHGQNPPEADDPEGFVTPAVAPKYRDAYEGTALPQDPSYNESDVSDKPTAIQANSPITAEETSALQEVYQQRLEAIRSADDQVRKIVNTLAESGQLDNTYIVVTSDNGYFLGEHRVRQGKILVYEPSVRVPLLMRGPGIPSGAVVEQLAGLHDLAPTVLHATGTFGAQTLPLDGRDLLPMVGNDDVAAERDLVLEAGPRDKTSDPYRYRAVRTHDGWKYVEYPTGEKEMYDLNADPYELENLAGDPAFADQQAALDLRLDELKNCAGLECKRPG